MGRRCYDTSLNLKGKRKNVLELDLEAEMLAVLVAQKREQTTEKANGGRILSAGSKTEK